VRLLLAVLLIGLSGCLSVHKLDVQQGNVVTQEMLEQLKTGMTRSQVRFVLGTALIADPFHADRWDYVYYFRKGRGGAVEQRRLTLLFRGDALVRIEGDAATRAGSPTASTPNAP
jgi:outer membrane protein assembly factor BamE